MKVIRWARIVDDVGESVSPTLHAIVHRWWDETHQGLVACDAGRLWVSAEASDLESPRCGRCLRIVGEG